MEIKTNHLEALVAAKFKEARKGKTIAVVVTMDRHAELTRLCKKYKLTQGDIINLVLDDYMDKAK